MPRRFSVLMLIVLVVSLLLPVSSASAQGHSFNLPPLVAGACLVGSNPEGFGFNVTYNWPDGMLVLDVTVLDPGTTGLYGTVSTSLPAGSGTNVNVAVWLPTTATLPVPYPWTFTARVVGKLNGVPTWKADMRISCPQNAGPYTVTELSNGPYSVGPVLPASANLHLVVADSNVLTGPGGNDTGLTIAACKTAFITDVSADGKYGEVFVMGGWIPLANTVDVAEDYGQPGGQAILPQCVGK